MKQLLALVAGLACFAVSADTTVGPELWNLYRGTSILQRDFPSKAACAKAADDLNVIRGYTCRTTVSVSVTADAPPPPAPPPPPEPPSAPTNVIGTSTLLSWIAPTEDGSLFAVEQQSNGGAYVVVARDFAALSWPISGLAPGDYCWRVYRIVREILSEPSTSWCATVAAPPPPPPPPPTTGGDPLANYRARIPWNNGAGGWGPQVQLEVAALPRTTRTVNVSSVEQFRAAAAVAGTLVNITSGWPGNTTAQIGASDVDVALPAGVSVGAIEVGVYPRANAVSRIRIRGATPGARGGRMGQYRDFEMVSDVTIDGVDVNGDSGFGGFETSEAFRPSGRRYVITNVRAIAGWYVWLGDARHVIIANSNLFHGAATTASLGGDPGGWAIRNSAGPFTIIDSRVQGTRYNQIRIQSSGGQGELFYAAGNTFVNTGEPGRFAWLWNSPTSTSVVAQGAVLEQNRFYVNIAAGCAAYLDLQAPQTQYTRVRGNDFYVGGGAASWSQATLDGQAKRPGGDHDWSGNRFLPYSGLPAWAGPGDPTQLPLPAGARTNGTPACAAGFGL